MRLRAIAAALLAAAGSAAGDVVTLVDGRRLEGELVERGGGLVLRGRYGEVGLHPDDVLSVERRATLDEELAARKGVLDPTDPDALGALAAWCRSKRLAGEARALEAQREAVLAEQAQAVRDAERQLREAVLTRRRAEASGDAVALHEVARWAEGQGYGRAVVEALLRDVLALSPAHVAALAWFDRRAAEEKAAAEREAAAAAWRAAERRRAAAAEAEEERREAIARAEQRRLDAETTAYERQAELAEREQAARAARAEAEARAAQQAAADQAAAWAEQRARQAAWAEQQARQAAWAEQRRCEEEARRRAWQERRRAEEREERRREAQRRREAEEERERLERDAIPLRGGSAVRAGRR